MPQSLQSPPKMRQRMVRDRPRARMILLHSLHHPGVISQPASDSGHLDPTSLKSNLNMIVINREHLFQLSLTSDGTTYGTDFAGVNSAFSTLALITRLHCSACLTNVRFSQKYPPETHESPGAKRSIRLTETAKRLDHLHHP